MCAAITTRMQIRSSKMRAFTKRATAHLFDLTLDKLVATALRAKFDEYELIGDDGQFDRSMIIKMLARKYFFGVMTVMFRSLPSDVARYIGKFFDFDVSFQPRAKKYITEQITVCNERMDEYQDNLDRGKIYYQDGEDYAPGEMISELSQRAFFTHMNEHSTVLRAYYRLVLERQKGKAELKYTSEDLIQMRQMSQQARIQIHNVRAERLYEFRLKQAKIFAEFAESVRLSDDFAPALERLEAIPIYIQCRAIAAKCPRARLVPPHW
jgi:hypothetical protein